MDVVLLKFNKTWIKLLAKTALDHDKLTKVLKEANTDFFTYIKPEESVKKIA